MSFYNCGVTFNGKRVATKKLLKEHVKENRTLHFDGTSMFQTVSGYWDVDIPEGIVLSVVGPDPYNKRDWYANVSVGKNGKLVVK